MIVSRRNLFGLFGSAAAVAAMPKLPSFLAVAPPIESAAPVVVPIAGSNTLLTISMISREAVRLFQQNSIFMQNMTTYDDCFEE